MENSRVIVDDPRGLNVTLYSSAYLAAKVAVLKNIKLCSDTTHVKTLSCKVIDVPDVRVISSINFWLDLVQREKVEDVAVVEVRDADDERQNNIFFLHNLIFKEEISGQLKCPLCSEIVEVVEIEAHLKLDAAKKSCGFTGICLFCLYSSNRDCILNISNSLMRALLRKNESPIVNQKKKHDVAVISPANPKEDTLGASRSRMNIHNKKIKHGKLFKRECEVTFSKELLVDLMDPIKNLLVAKRSALDGVLPQNCMTNGVASILGKHDILKETLNIIGGIEDVSPETAISHQIQSSVRQSLSASLSVVQCTKTVLYENVLKNYERKERNAVFRGLMVFLNEVQLSEFLDSVFNDE